MDITEAEYWAHRLARAGAGELTCEAARELCDKPLIFHNVDYANGLISDQSARVPGEGMLTARVRASTFTRGGVLARANAG